MDETTEHQPEEVQEEQPDLVKKWLREIELYDKEFKPWKERVKKILKRYRDDKTNQNDRQRKYNIFWSNVETLKPALYARTPKPEVQRKFKDADPVGRVASDILERGTSYSIKEYDFDSTVKALRDDYLRVGRGTSWVRYIPTFANSNTLDANGQPVQQVAYEEVRCEYVHWDDFGHTARARVWDEVTAVWRKLYLTREELKQQFGEEGLEVELNFESPSETESQLSKAMAEKKAEVFEIWDKRSRSVIWISRGYKGKPLRVLKDPLGLKRFFPCPRPLYSTLTTDNLIPLPDYCMYQDQATELDVLTNRISLLTEALRVAGVYDESCEGVQDLVNSTYENKLIPVKGWTQFSAEGGVEGAIQWLPIEQIVKTMRELREEIKELKADIFEITGISDIVRGNTSPNETATAQQIKGQFATLRISDRQQDVQRYIRDLIEIKAEIIAEHFQPQTLALIADINVSRPEMQQLFMQAVQLLRDDSLRSFRVDIETDSTIALDESQEKQDRNEFIQAIGGFMGNALQLMQGAPAFTPAIGEMLLFFARGFKVGRSLEAALEQGVQGTMQQIQQAQSQPPPPDPKMEAEKMRLQGELQKMAQEMQQMREEHALKMQALMAEVEAAKQEAAIAERQAMIKFRTEMIAKREDREAAKVKQQQESRL